ncbi:MAG: precorrin-6y C5,15-methyltransferase (decarboxylating) subunit CbiE [Alphaproteobacteria bacterium]
MDKPKNWLSIVGIGDDGLDGLGVNAKRVIETADLVIGGKRHLSFLSSGDQKHLQWPTPWNTMLQDLNAAKQAGEKVVVLASGDPFWFGAGSLVAKHFDQNEWSSVPHPSSFQFAAHRLGWPLQACKTISLHGYLFSFF